MLLVAHALFASPAAATAAVSKLHAHVFKGSLLSATLKKRLDGATKVVVKVPKAEHPKAPAITPSRANRLIVRNLPFNITEQDIRALFLPYGPIYSIDIPTIDEQDADGSSGERKKPRIKGFAFVWMLSRKDAEKAMEGCNGRIIRAGMADTLMSDKQKKKKQRREEKKRNAAEVREEEEDVEEDADEVKVGAERTIAVDWALSKDKWEKVKAELEEEDDVDMTQSDEDEEKEEAGPSEQVESSDADEDDHLGIHHGDSDSHPETSDEEGNSDDEVDSQAPAKPSLPQTDTGTTVFVRNVPFEATEDELRTL